MIPTRACGAGLFTSSAMAHPQGIGLTSFERSKAVTTILIVALGEWCAMCSPNIVIPEA